MKFYTYTAISSQGQRTKGIMQALNRDHLAKILLNTDRLFLLSARWAWGFACLYRLKTVSWDWLQRFFFQIACLARAGVPIPEALNTLREMESSRYHRWIIGSLFLKVQQGQYLSEAIQMYPKDFPTLTFPMIRIGELSGTLGTTFDNLSSYALWRYENQKSIRQMIRYPLLVLSLVVALIGFLITFVLPSLTGFLDLSGAENQIQEFTLKINALTHCISWVFCVVLTLGIGVFIINKMSPQTKLQGQKLLWNAPFYRDIMPCIIRTRFFQALSFLVSGGVSILEAFPLAAEATHRELFKVQTQEILKKVQAGTALEQAVSQDDILLNPLHKHLLSIAEKSGTMTSILKELQRLSQEEMVRTVKNLTGWLEPSLLALLGGLMGWIAWAVFHPLYSQLGTMGGGT